MRIIGALILTLAFAACAVACNGGDSEAPTPHTDVALTFTEWEIAVEPSDVPAGDFTFELDNPGEVAHNLVIAKSDLPPGQLPTSNGTVDKSKLNVTGSAGPIAPGTSTAGADGYLQSLSPGKYVLFCDVAAGGSNVDSHYQNGMYASLLVEP